MLGVNVGRHRPGHGRTFLVLMLLAAAAMALPLRVGRSISLTVGLLFRPLSSRAYSALSAVRHPSGLPVQQISREELEALAAAGEVWQNEAMYLARLLESREETIRRLTRLREEIPIPQARLIPARVQEAGLSPWQDMAVADRGSRDAVREGHYVLSGMTAGRGQVDGVNEGMAVLAVNYLIGRVAAVSPYSCQIRLVADLGNQMPVVVRHVAAGAGKPETSPGVECLLEGTGRSTMICRNVAHHLEVRKGDAVLTRGNDPDLPFSLLVGYVTQVTPLAENPAVVILSVAPRMDVHRVQNVYILDPTRGGKPAGR